MVEKHPRIVQDLAYHSRATPAPPPLVFASEHFHGTSSHLKLPLPTSSVWLALPAFHQQPPLYLGQESKYMACTLPFPLPSPGQALLIDHNTLHLSPARADNPSPSSSPVSHFQSIRISRLDKPHWLTLPALPD